ncbi:hypothetical protein J6590_079117 [Homalodisca vitripennis]|nr:hypothetical protein J6590_079117 [Homalodisca vitripennis]
MTGTQQHDYNTRHAVNYHLPAHRLASTEKKPTYVGAKLWNALPLELKRRDRLQHRAFLLTTLVVINELLMGHLGWGDRTMQRERVGMEGHLLPTTNSPCVGIVE